MKMRTDYVSNSSSSSFVLLGKTMDFDKFMKAVKAAGYKNEDDEDHDDFCNAKDWLYSVTGKFIGAEASGYDGDYDYVVVGADPSVMNDIDTLKEFKERIINELEKAGIKASIKDIVFTSGGSDASGMSFIESCG